MFKTKYSISIWSSVALRKSPQKPYVVNVSIKSFANWMWVSFFFCALCNTVFGVYVSEKKNVWWLWYGSSSCLCCTLLKGNCLEAHENLKGIVYGVIKISPSINSVMPFSMTTLLMHTAAHSTKPSFMPKTNNHPHKKFLSLALEQKLSKMTKFWLSKSIIYIRKISESFWKKNRWKIWF